MALKKSEIKRPTLPKRAVPVDVLGGEVVVRGLMLKERLALFAGEAESKFAQISGLLAACVLDADGVPIFTADEWESFGAQHMEQSLVLFEVVRELSGLNAEVAQKN